MSLHFFEVINQLVVCHIPALIDLNVLPVQTDPDDQERHPNTNARGRISIPVWDDMVRIP